MATYNYWLDTKLGEIEQYWLQDKLCGKPLLSEQLKK